MELSVLSLAVLAVLCLLPGADPVRAQSTTDRASVAELHVTFDGGLLTVDARNVLLQDLLEEVAAQSGLALSTRGLLGKRVTRAFTELELSAAIDKLLHGMSYALQYPTDSPSLPSRLWVMSGGNLLEEGAYRDADATSNGLRQDRFEVPASQRLEAVAALAERDTETFAFAIAPALGDDSAAVRYEAVHALGEVGGDTSTGLLHQLLSDPDAGIRAAAIDALAEAGGELSAVTLSAALHDPDPALRENAVYALGEIGGERAVELLDQAAADPDEWVRQAVDEVLSELADQD